MAGNAIDNYVIKHPCKNCPMRKDCTSNWLGGERINDIMESDSFVCHETSTGVKDKSKWKQCAGHMILTGNQNIFVRFADKDEVDLKLRGKELIFDDKEQCINHHTYNEYK